MLCVLKLDNALILCMIENLDINKMLKLFPTKSIEYVKSRLKLAISISLRLAQSKPASIKANFSRIAASLLALTA